MSARCAACGGFYNEKCGRWPDCAPAEEADHYKLILANQSAIMSSLYEILTNQATTRMRDILQRQIIVTDTVLK